MKLSERIRDAIEFITEGPAVLLFELADEVAKLEEDFTSTMQSLAKRNKACAHLEEEKAELMQFEEDAFDVYSNLDLDIEFYKERNALLTDTQESE